MLTVLCYVALSAKFGSAWSGWLLVIPVITDIAVIDKMMSCK
jgi:hypothetical protein